MFLFLWVPSWLYIFWTRRSTGWTVTKAHDFFLISYGSVKWVKVRYHHADFLRMLGLGGPVGEPGVSFSSPSAAAINGCWKMGKSLFGYIRDCSARFWVITGRWTFGKVVRVFFFFFCRRWGLNESYDFWVGLVTKATQRIFSFNKRLILKPSKSRFSCGLAVHLVCAIFKSHFKLQLFKVTSLYRGTHQEINLMDL